MSIARRKIPYDNKSCWTIINGKKHWNGLKNAYVIQKRRVLMQLNLVRIAQE
jgi:hypothetical protein